MSKPNMI